MENNLKLREIILFLIFQPKYPLLLEELKSESKDILLRVFSSELCKISTCNQKTSVVYQISHSLTSLCTWILL